MSELLGEIVSWDVEGKEISFATIRDALNDAGLDKDAIGEMTPKAAFQRACKDLKQDRAIDKVENRKGEIKFQFTKKTLEEQHMEYEYECFVILSTETGAVSCPENPDLATKAEELIQHAIGHRNAQDITRLVQNLFGKHADLFPINPRKGVAYFVPEEHREFTAKIDHFLSRVGGSLARFPVPKGTEEGNKSVRDAVQSGLASLVEELNQAVTDWDESTRKGTMERALERFKEIEYKVDAYAEYLSASTDGLREKLIESKKALVEKITSLKPEEAPVNSEPEPVGV